MAHDDALSAREREVLAALCAVPFRSRIQIALDLGIEERTLRTHISAILAKTGAADQRELVLKTLHERIAHQNITKLDRAGRRLAVVTVTPILPSDVHEAIVMLNIAGKTVHVFSVDVAAVLEGLEDQS